MPTKSEYREELTQDEGGVVVFGGAVVDLIGQSSFPLIQGTSNPGLILSLFQFLALPSLFVCLYYLFSIIHSLLEDITQSIGGVGRNIAEGIARLQKGSGDNTVHLISAVGHDSAGGSFVFF